MCINSLLAGVWSSIQINQLRLDSGVSDFMCLRLQLDSDSSKRPQGGGRVSEREREWSLCKVPDLRVIIDFSCEFLRLMPGNVSKFSGARDRQGPALEHPGAGDGHQEQALSAQKNNYSRFLWVRELCAYIVFYRSYLDSVINSPGTSRILKQAQLSQEQLKNVESESP